MAMLSIPMLAIAGLVAVVSPSVHAQSTAVVNFGNNTGPPQQLAAGLLYGVPDNGTQVPSTFYSNMGFNYLRAGGAQLPAPARGWIWGVTEYQNRFKSALANYGVARAHNASFIFLIHDLYGADGTQNSSTPFPGDNGDFSYWQAYLDHLIPDMKKHQMTSGTIIDIWNEPDGSGFWPRSQAQYLQLWAYTYARLRAAFGNAVALSGPASAGEPLPSNSWWTNYAAFIAQNGSIPDQYAWHMESGGGDMLSAYGGLIDILNTNGLPLRTVNINEYAVYNEQVPAGSAWWISQLERVGARGLRGNWLSGYQLHDFLASLLGKPNGDTSVYKPRTAGYWPNGDYQVYKYYNLNMTGSRFGTLPSGDLSLDAYATVGADGLARVLVGVRPSSTGTWTLQLNDLSALGLPSSGTLNVHTWGFRVNTTDAADVHFGVESGPQDLGVYGHAYSGNTVSFPIYQTDTTSAFAFEFSVGTNTTA